MVNQAQKDGEGRGYVNYNNRGSSTTSRNELFHWFLKQYITGYNNAPIPE